MQKDTKIIKIHKENMDIVCVCVALKQSILILL